VKKFIRISIPVLLIAALGLSQIGAGFFHNKHDAHKNTVVLDAGEFAIQEHGEHCKLCAIDLITLFNEVDELANVQDTARPSFVLPIVGLVSATKTFAKDRAPPVFC